MSNYVDERIVEMKFDNQNFEKNVQVSLKTLDELNKKLKLEDAGKSFENIQNASSKIDLSNLANNVQTVADRCSTLGIVGDEIIRRLTNGFMDLNQAVITTVKSLTIDQIGVGFDKYERKVQSVQTIMNATGKSIDEVSAALDKLNWFTDETSYSYADMVDNISKFTSSNVDLDTAVTSMIGIADAAGLAGATVQDASHAMEGFSKAIAQGYMSRQNWQWIRTAHMDTTKFKDVLIQAAVAEGTLTEAMDGTYNTIKGTTVSIADFETALKDGWMTTEVINSALNEFGGTTEKIYSEYQKFAGDKTTSEIIASMGTSIDDLGLKSFRAAQEAKTFSDAINSVKDAVSTGWMTSFEQIFGNYEEARYFWTDVANEMWDIFASSGESRNELIAEVFSGAFKDFQSELSSMGVSIDKFEESLKGVTENAGLDVEALVGTYGSLSEAFRAGAISGDIAKEALRGLANEMTVTSTETVDLSTKLTEIKGKVNEVIQGVYGDGEARRQALEELGYSYEYIQGLVNQILLEGREITLDDVKIFEQEIQTMTGLTEEQRQALLAFIDGNEEANASFDELISNMQKKTGQELVHGMILNLLGGIKDVQEAFRSASETIFGGSEERATFLYSLLENLYELSEKFRLTEESSENLQKTISGLLSILQFFISTGEKILNILSPIRSLFNLSGASVLEFSGNVGETITNFVKWYDESEEVSEVVDKLRGYVERFVNVLKNLSGYIKRLAENFLPIVQSGLNDIKKYISNSPIPGFLNRIKTRIRDLWRYIEKIDFASINIDLSGFSSFISNAADAILDLYKAIKDYLTPYIDKAKTALSNFNTVLDPIRKRIDDLKLKIKDSGGIISYLRQQIIDLKNKITDFIKNGGLGTLFDSFVNSFGPVKEKLSKFLDDVGKELQNIDWGSVLAFSIGFSLVPAILSISAAFTEAAKLFKTGKGVLGTISGILTKFKNGFKTTVMEIAEAAVGFSIAIAILAGAIWLLATQVEKSDLLRSVTMLVAVMGAFLIMVAGISAAIHFLKIDPKSMLGIMAFAGAIGVLAVSLKVLENIKISWGQILSILGLMAAMAAAAIGLSKFGVKLEGVGLYFLTFAGAILVLSIAMQKLGDIPKTKIYDSMQAIVVLMAALTVITTASKLVKGSAFGVLALAGSIYLLIKLLEILSDNKIKTLVAKASENWMLLTGILITVAGLAFLLGKLDGGKSAAKIGLGVALMAASLLIVVEVVKKFAEIDNGALAKGLTAVGAVLILYSVLAAASSIGKGNGIKAGAGIAIMAASLLIIYFAVKQFASLDVGALNKGLGAISVIMTMFAVLLGMTALSGLGKMGPIIAMVVALGAIVAAIIVLTLYDWDQITTSLKAIGIALLAFIGAMIILSLIKPDAMAIGGMVIMIAGLIVIAGVLQHLASYSWESLTAAAVAIGVCLAAIVASMGVLSMITFGPDKMLGAFVALGLGLLAFWAIGTILKSLGEFSWSGHVATAAAISTVLIAIAGAMDLLALIPATSVVTAAGALFAALVAVGAAVFLISWMIEAMPIESIAQKFATASASLPTIGDNIKALCESLKGIPDIDPKIAEIFEKIANAFATLVMAQFVDNIMKLIPGFDSFADLGPKMEAFGESISKLAKSLPNKSELEKVTIAIDSLATIAYIIQNIPKNADWKKLTKNLSSFGEAMNDYGSKVSGMDYEAIANSVGSVKNVSDIANMLPTTGGFISLFTGHTAWTEISTNLVDFGDAIAKYGAKANQIVRYAGAIEESVSSVRNVSDIANMLPTTGGFISLFTGSTDWDGIITHLNLFGSAIAQYGVTVTDLAVGPIESSVFALKNIVTAVDSAYNSTGFVEMANGNLDMRVAKQQLIAYAEGIRDFSLIASAIDYEALASASDLHSIGENFGLSIAKGISASDADVMKSISKLINSAQENISKKASSFVSAGSKIASNVSTGILSGVNVINAAIGEYSNVVIKEIGTLVEKIPSEIQNGNSEINNSVVLVITGCVSRIRGFYGEFVSAASYLANGFAVGFQINSINTSIDATISSLTYNINNHYYDFYYAGKYIVQGVADGIIGNTYLAVNAVSYMSDRMENRLLEMNKINSPSKLYSKWSKFIPMGVADGIANNSDLAENAVSDMGHDMLAAISPALSILSRLVNEGFEISPQIHPVVDMDDVYASVDQISKMFNEQSVMATAKANNVSKNVSQYEDSRYRSTIRTPERETVSSPVINNYIYAQPGQSVEEIADAVERRMVRSLTQRKVAHVK